MTAEPTGAGVRGPAQTWRVRTSQWPADSIKRPDAMTVRELGPADLLRWLECPAPWPSGPTHKACKERLPHMSFAEWAEPSRRTGVPVVRVHGIALDYDNDRRFGAVLDELTLFDHRVGIYGHPTFYAYTSASYHHSAAGVEVDGYVHGPWRWRVLMPYAAPIGPDDHELLVDWLRAEGKLGQFGRESSDPARVFFLPAQAPGGYKHQHRHGHPLDPLPLLERARAWKAEQDAADAQRRAEEAQRYAEERARWAADHPHDPYDSERHALRVRRNAEATIASSGLATWPAGGGRGGGTGRGLKLYSVACSVFGPVKGHEVDRAPVAALLFEAAIANGLVDRDGAASVQRDIDRAFAWVGPRLLRERERVAPIDTSTMPPLDPSEPLPEIPMEREPSDEADDEGAVRARLWRQFAVKGARGEERIRTSLLAAKSILAEDPRWAGKIRHDEMADRTLIGGELMTDATVIAVACWLEETYGAEWAPDKVRNALSAVAHEHQFHPVREYLAGLPAWDGTLRLDRLLWDYFGVERPKNENEQRLHAAYGRNLLISLVARGICPGSKVDSVLTLQGDQGLGKSTGLAALMPDPAMFMDDPVPFDDHKRLVMVLRPRWLCEFADFASVKRADADRVKGFLTQRCDSGVPAYGRAVVEVPRGVVFVATANDPQFLIEAGRRWCVVTVTQRVNVERIRTERDLLFAEALHRYQAKEPWWLPEELQKLQRELVQGYAVTDPMVDAIVEWTANRTPSQDVGLKIDWLWNQIALPMLAKSEEKPPNATVGDLRAFAGALRKAHWRHDQEKKTRRNRWFPPLPEPMEPVEDPSAVPF